MSATITWKISQLDRSAATGFVTSVHYRVEATEDSYNASSYGVVSYEQTEGESFIPFEQLTEQQVIGWVQASLDQANIEATLQGQIDAQKAPATLTGIPWFTGVSE